MTDVGDVLFLWQVLDLDEKFHRFCDQHQVVNYIILYDLLTGMTNLSNRALRYKTQNQIELSLRISFLKLQFFSSGLWVLTSAFFSNDCDQFLKFHDP